MNFDDLPDFYSHLDKQFQVINADQESATYTNVDSNFVFSSKYPRHRWFNYKEGFSPVLVERLLEENGMDSSCVICDPFCGAGTTLTVAKSHDIHSIGFEVNPFASFISDVKTDDYSAKDIKRLQDCIQELHNIDPTITRPLPQNEYVCRIFDPEMLTTQLNIKAYIFGLKDSKHKKLLRFAWLCTLENCSLYRKAGNGLKKKTHPPKYSEGKSFEYALEQIESKTKLIIDDYCDEANGPIPVIYTDSVTTIKDKVEKESIDMVLFSPPYANCFDYTKIYYLELWFGGFIDTVDDQKNIRMKSLRSHCHATWPDRYTEFYLEELNGQILPLLEKQELWTNRIPGMLNGYFADMKESLRQIYDSLKPGGYCDIVVSNSAYAGIIIPTDALLAKIAMELGYSVKEIEVERLIITSSQQYRKTEHIKQYLRESIVKLEKRN